jgi:hypothetical protein
MKSRWRPALAWRFAAALAATMPAACGGSGGAFGDQQATIERAAIHRDLKRDLDALYKIAATRAKSSHTELRGQPVTCATSNVDIQFVNGSKAIYTASYACGIAPWTLGKTPPVATPMIKVELLKERSTWIIDAFL